MNDSSDDEENNDEDSPKTPYDGDEYHEMIIDIY